MSTSKISSVFFILFIAVSFPAGAQSQERIYATMIVNFARGVQWPQGGIQDNFVIGVFAYAPLATALVTMTSPLKIGGKAVRIKEVTDPHDAAECNILFLPSYKGKSLPEILKVIGSKPVLIITNKTNLARQGSGINFLLVDGRLRYEINSKAIEARGLKIPLTIKQMGIEVQ